MPNCSSEKKVEKSNDVHLSQILDLTTDMKMDSPLKEGVSYHILKECCQDKDVRLEEVLNAPSLSISL